MTKKPIKFEAGIIYTDAHAPGQDKASCRIVQEVVKDLKPRYAINLGDGGDFSSINHFNKGKPRVQEKKRLHHDLMAMYELDDYLTEFAPKDCKKVRLIGNHEYWVERYLDEHPELEGLPDLDIAGTYKRMGWKVIPWGEFHHIGKLFFHHGDRKGYQRKYHAAIWADCGKSIVYGHRHDMQRFTGEQLTTEDDFIPSTGISIGCLAIRQPDWMGNRRNNWSNGFGVFYMRPGGFFNVYQVDIIKGVCMWNGKVYDGR